MTPVACAYAVRPEVTDANLREVSNLLCQDHVFYAVDPSFRSYVGAHRLFRSFEDGSQRLYFSYAGDGKFLGCAWGGTESEFPRQFYGHFIFHRHVDAFSCVDRMIGVCDGDYRADGVVLATLCSVVPDYNRAAGILNRRLGFKDMGVVDRFEVRGADDRLYRCRKFVLDMEEWRNGQQRRLEQQEQD